MLIHKITIAAKKMLIKNEQLNKVISPSAKVKWPEKLNFIQRQRDKKNMVWNHKSLKKLQILFTLILYL